ncbi:hypothetical protein ANANG_G00218340 [Anguilla anguilla]|uniref:Reverse transcriptase domain-containing protein n=1 Tax=Anguilla anguilla TaxID=7936 RepID=A0A9D3LVQ4_ANGAN|nr:hypothetical protein ANANG_G00218340 [Anguilla anguilla]
MITDIDPSSLSSFTVKPLTLLSDHSHITLFIKSSDIKMAHKHFHIISFCVNSNLGGAFFCSIVNARLLNFLTKHNVLSKSQIGFIPKHRTTDHIYTLHTLIDKHINQNKTIIYACFIDFQKAFDSIWHAGLFCKVIESGVGSKTYDIIKSIYSGNMFSVKIGKKGQNSLLKGEVFVRAITSALHSSISTLMNWLLYQKSHLSPV